MFWYKFEKISSFITPAITFKNNQRLYLQKTITKYSKLSYILTFTQT